MPKYPSPFQIWKLGFDAWRFSFQTQTVMMMRLTGMAGMWTLAPGETSRMVTEKQQAFMQSSLAGMSAAMRGQGPDRILNAAMQPLSRKTSANSKRLGRSAMRQLAGGKKSG